MSKKMTVMEITGGETEQFLQGQVTIDLFSLPSQCWGISAYCVPNGRVFACFYLFRREKNHLFLVLPTSMCEPFCQRLRKFILRQEVKIKVCPHLSFKVLPPDSAEGVLFFSTGLKVAIEEKSQSLESIEGAIFTMACIQSGMPMIYPATSERFLPQMLNLPALGGLSLTKGCYVGQEGVARAQYKTEIHRHLAWAELPVLPISLEIGMPVVNDKGSPVGGVMDFVITKQRVMIQAVIEDRYLGKSLTIATNHHPTLIFNI